MKNKINNEQRNTQENYITASFNQKEDYIREQKRSIIQSSIDRKLYHQEGDEACTSGVSMTSSEIKQDSDTVLEEEKSGVYSQTQNLEIHSLNEDQEYVWYAAYDWEMRDEVFNDIIHQWADQTYPLNKVSIKLENFDIVFAAVGNLPGMVYLQQRTCGSWFIKLYLINTNQLLEIAKNKNLAFSSNYTDFSILSPLLVNKKESVIIDQDLPYGYLLRIGEYSNFSIYSLTNSHLQILCDVKNSWDPSDFYIKEFFKAMSESFPNFSSDFLLYYINSKKGLKNKLNSQLMAELREFGTLRSVE